MVVSVVLSGLPQYVTLQDLGSNLDKVFDTDYIKTFHIRDLPDHPTTGKRRVALDFKSGFDGAMEAQSLLDGYKYSLDTGKTYILKAKINHDPSLRRTNYFDDYSFDACLVQYHDMAHGRIHDMHLDSLKKQYDVIRSERKLLKEKKKLKREIKELNESAESSSDSEKRYSKKHKKRDKKKHKKKKKRDRRPSDSLSSSEALASSGRSDARSMSPSVRRKIKSPSIEEFRPRTTDSKGDSRRLSRALGSALVPYTKSQHSSPLAAPAPQSPMSAKRNTLVKRGNPSSESPTRMERSRLRRSPDSPPKRRALSRRSPEPPRRRPPARRSRSASPPPKRQRVSATVTRAEPLEERERGYRWSSPSPPRSSRFEKAGCARKGDMASTSRSERELPRPSYGGYSGRDVDKSYQFGDDADLTKDIDDLLESVKNEDSKSSDDSASETVNINLKMNVVKRKKPVEEQAKKPLKKKKKMPLPIKMESDEDKPRARTIGHCMPKPMVDQKAANVKREQRESTDDDNIEDGEIQDDHGKESRYSLTEAAVDYINLPWVPVTPEQPPSPKRVPPNPRFVLPITKIITSMKKHFSSLEEIEKYRMNAVLKDLLLARLKDMLKNEKGYKCTKEILVMYREHHPLELDEQFVEDTLKEIAEGLYDVWIDDDNTCAHVKQEREDCKENIRPLRQLNGANADVSGQWVPFKPVEPDNDILILEPAKPTLDLTVTDENTPDINSILDLSHASKVLKKEIKIDSSEEFSFLQDTISTAKTSDASDSTVVLDAQSPSVAIANLKVEPPDEADLGLTDFVKQEFESNEMDTGTATQELIHTNESNPSRIKEEKSHQEIVPAGKSIASESQNDKPTESDVSKQNINIKTETEETLDDIAKFIQEVEVDKKVIDLTKD